MIQKIEIVSPSRAGSVTIFLTAAEGTSRFRGYFIAEKLWKCTKNRAGLLINGKKISTFETMSKRILLDIRCYENVYV